MAHVLRALASSEGRARAIAVLVALVGLLALLYAPVLAGLFGLWWGDLNYSHGLLVPPLVAFVVWSKRDALRAQPLEPSAWGALVLAAGLLLLVFGWVVEAVGSGRGGLFVRGLSLIAVLAGLVLFLGGRGFLRILMFPLAYLLFMVPLPAGAFAMVTLPLQLQATDLTTAALQLLGVPALREGNLVQLPHVTLGITEACSGIRSILALLAGATALSWFAQDRAWQRVVLVGSVIPVAVVANAVRTTVTGWLAHEFGAELAEGFFHGFSGWLIILLASVILCGEVLLLERLAGKRAPDPRSAG